MRAKPRQREVKEVKMEGGTDGGREACQRRDEGRRWEWIRAKLELQCVDSSRGNRINSEAGSQVRVALPPRGMQGRRGDVVRLEIFRGMLKPTDVGAVSPVETMEQQNFNTNKLVVGYIRSHFVDFHHLD